MIDETAITFAAGTRDRAANIRGDADRMAALWAAPGARVTPVWRGKPLFRVGDGQPALEWLPTDAPILIEGKDAPVFLGLEGADARYALDVSAWEDPELDPHAMTEFLDQSQNVHPSLGRNVKFIDLRSIMAELTGQDAADAAAAKGVLEWHRTHRYCAKCGAESAAEEAGWRRKCTKCNAFHFPRTDPVVIMLVQHGDKALLGRQSFWPEGMYSMLAGFMEPGETLEAAVRRETMEETGVTVARVRYLACQPWPFPASLMIACAAEATDTMLDVDHNELEEAFWVTRDDIRASLAGTHPKIRAARLGAIARSVLEAWSKGDVPDFD
jgi:NAD+ diphosphatase